MNGDLYTTIERQGNITVITQMTKVNRHCRAKKISKDEYVNLSTGEICEYEQHGDTRADNKKSLLRTFDKIRGLVNANAEDPRKVKFITLTYAENMTDPKRLYMDFKSFWQRFLYWHKKHEWEKPEYLIVIEPQQRGAFHGHLLLFYPSKVPFFPEGELEKIWNHGFIKISRIDQIDNLGAYLSAYLSDIAVDAEDGDRDAIEIDGEKKSIIKGGRLHMYPPGMNIYRCSRGLRRPQKRQISQEAADAYRRNHDPSYAITRTLQDSRTGFETVIYKEWFNEFKYGSNSSVK